jgi:hypothetical protein
MQSACYFCPIVTNIEVFTNFRRNQNYSFTKPRPVAVDVILADGQA